MKGFLLVFFSIASIGCPHLCRCQATPTSAEPDTVLAEQYFDTAQAFIKETAYDSVVAYFQKAIDIYEQAAAHYDDPEVWLRCMKIMDSRGYYLCRKGAYDESLDQLNRALDIGLKHVGEKHDDICTLYNSFGTLYYRKGDVETAGHYYRKALNIRRELFGENHSGVASGYNNVGIIYYMKGHYDKAIEYYSKSLAIKRALFGEEHRYVANTLNNIGNVYYQKFDYRKTLEYYNKCLAIRLKLHGERHPDVAASYNRIGMAYELQGDLERAEDYANKALSLKLELLDPEHPEIANSYHFLATIHLARGEYDAALELYNKSLAINLSVLGEKHYDVSFIYDNIGLLFQRKGEYDKASEYFQKALSLNTEVFGERHPYVVNSLRELGDVAHVKGDDNKALMYYQDGLDRIISLFGEKHHTSTELTLRIGKVYHSRDNIEMALSYAQEAIIRSTGDFDDKRIYANPSLDNIVSEEELLNALHFKAVLLKELYHSGKKNVVDLETSLSTYRLAIDVIDIIRNSYESEGSKFSLGEERAPIYEEAIETAVQVFEITQNKQHIETAFQFSEKAKANVLLASLQDSRAMRFAGIPDSLLDREKELRIDLTFYDTEIQLEIEKQEEMDSLKVSEFQDRYFALTTEYQSLIEHIETEYPEYFNLKYQTQPVSIAELQGTLDEKSVILEYFAGDSAIYIFTISQHNFAVMRLEGETVFQNDIEHLSEAIKKVDPQKYVQAGHAVFRRLIQPIERWIDPYDRLIIIPHGPLFKIPYEALLTQLPQDLYDIDFRKLSYLIKDYEITYHYSSMLYLNSKQRGETPVAAIPPVTGDFIGFAPVFSDEAQNGYILESNKSNIDFAYAEDIVRSVSLDGKRFNTLDHSEEEVRQIVQLFGKKKRDAVGYFHGDASEGHFKSDTGKHRYIHIATHGLINEENPQLSGIIFSQPMDSLYMEDGILYSGETYNLDLHADLVVLSSCESGTGKLVQGEGLMALTRGFLYSGASNLIVSLWKVSDKHTCDLMVELYRNILSGKSHTESLRKAKLNMIKNESTAFPRSWSSFVIIGG